MSHHPQNPYVPTQPGPVEPPEQPEKKRRGRGGFWFAGGVATGTVIAIAFTAGDGTEPAAQPEPEVVTETVTETVTEEVEVEVVPQACLDAADAGDRVVQALDFMTGWTSDYLGAVSEMDLAGMEALNGELGAAGDTYEGVVTVFDAAAADCRDAS